MKRFSIVGLCIALLLTPLFLFAAAPSADYPYPNVGMPGSGYAQPYNINLAQGDSIPSIVAPAPFINPALSFPWIQIIPADATITPALPGVTIVLQDRIPNAPISFSGKIPSTASGLYTISIPARNINDYCADLKNCGPLPPNASFPFIIQLQVGPPQPPTVKPITPTPATIDQNYNFQLSSYLTGASTVSLNDQGIMTFNDFGLGLLNNGNDAWIIYPDHEVNLPKQADGRYTNGTAVFSPTPADATLTDGEKVNYSACKAQVEKKSRLN